MCERKPELFAGHMSLFGARSMSVQRERERERERANNHANNISAIPIENSTEKQEEWIMGKRLCSGFYKRREPYCQRPAIAGTIPIFIPLSFYSWSLPRDDK